MSQPNTLPTLSPYTPTRDQYLSPLQYTSASTPPLATSSQMSFTPPRMTHFYLAISHASPMTPYVENWSLSGFENPGYGEVALEDVTEYRCILLHLLFILFLFGTLSFMSEPDIDCTVLVKGVSFYSSSWLTLASDYQLSWRMSVPPLHPPLPQTTLRYAHEKDPQHRPPNIPLDRDHDQNRSSHKLRHCTISCDDRDSQKPSTLLLTSERRDLETHCTNIAGCRAADCVSCLRAALDAKSLAEQNTAWVIEELRLYKIQLDTAQQEIFRAQDVLDKVEKARHDVELDAAKARSKAQSYTNNGQS
jgi:hypothetical protein